MAISTQGTKLEIALHAGSPTDYTEIPNVKDISGPSETSDELEITHLGSVGGRREYIQSFRDSDDITVQMNYLPGNAVQDSLRALYESGDIVSARVTYPDDATATFNCFVKGRSSPAAVAAVLEFNVTLRVTGAVTYVIGA